MLALYRSGRQADALDVYRRTRDRLRDELGLEPGKELTALQAAILSQDPAIDAPARQRLAGRSVSDRRRSGALLLIAGGAGALLAAVAAVAVILLDGGDALELSPNSVAVLDAGTGDLVDDIAVGVRPDDVAIGLGSVWIANLDDDSITKIDPESLSVDATISPGIAVDGGRSGDGWSLGDRREARPGGAHRP